MPALTNGDLDPIVSDLGRLSVELRRSRIFITGATGFIGSWLLESFVRANEKLDLQAEVVVLTRDSSRFIKQAPHLARHPAIRIHEGDVRSFSFPKGEFSHVIHGAASTNAKINEGDPLLALDTSVEGTRRTLEFARKAGSRSYLFLSSGAVYGPQPSEMTHMSEEYTGGPDLAAGSTYAQGKRLGEHLCALYHRHFGIATKIARCFAFVGPHLPLDQHYAIGNFIRDGLAGGPVRVQGDGTAYRSYLYASDLATWLWTILAEGAPCRPYNVGSETALSIAKLAQETAAVLGVGVQTAQEPVPGRPPARYVPSTQRARVELGLKEHVNLNDAIRRTALWHRPLAAPARQAPISG